MNFSLLETFSLQTSDPTITKSASPVNERTDALYRGSQSERDGTHRLYYTDLLHYHISHAQKEREGFKNQSHCHE